MSTRLERRVVAKTADYTINPTADKPGTVFTNRGATGAVTFTLPPATPANTGWWYRFRGVADQTITIASSVVDTLLAFNDAAADSVAMSTGGQKIGGEMEAFCDGTTWAVTGLSVGVTFTVAT